MDESGKSASTMAGLATRRPPREEDEDSDDSDITEDEEDIMEAEEEEERDCEEPPGGDSGDTPQRTPLELGVGPTAAVWDIGDTQEVEETVTPLMVTSVGALISRTGAGLRGAALGGGPGGPGGRGWGLRGTIVARRGQATLLGDTVPDRVLLVRGGGIGGMSVVSWIE